jgi:DNA primase
MRFPDSFLDEIRARLPASQVVGRRVKLKKQGREFAGLSPFNAEKTPSFFVNDTKGKWFDFSAGRNGDIFSFVMETEGLSFPEAVERLAQEAGVPMPASDPASEAREKQRASLYDVVEAACRFFEQNLQSREASGARSYLDRRRMGPDVQKRFRLGYAGASRNALKEHLAAQGIPQEQMIEAGLLVSGDDIPVSFDRFRERVIFPITDFKGRVVAFGGRALASDVPAKYLNSPETPLFHKGSLLYNGAEARKAAHEAGTIIVVEGYVDAIAMSEAGFRHTVAPLGTALTERQLEILWRMTEEPILCFDGDSAGVRAAYRVIDLALPMLKPGFSVRFALLPEGKDPDDLIGAAGVEAMRGVIDHAQPLIEMLWARETEGRVYETPERRAELEMRLREIARSIADQSVRRHYEQALTERVQAFFAPAARTNTEWYRGTGNDWRRAQRETGGRGRSSSARYPDFSRRPVAVSDALRRSTRAAGLPALREAVLVVTLINCPGLIAAHLDVFAHTELGSRELDSLREQILEIAGEDPSIDATALRGRLEAAGFAALLERLDGLIRRGGVWQAGPGAADRDAEEGWLQAVTLHRKSRTLHKELKEAEAALATEPSDANLARMVEIQRQLANTDGTEALIDGFGASSGRPSRNF